MTEKWREQYNNKIDTYIKDLAFCWNNSKDTTEIKLTQFTKYVPKNSLMQFLARYELYKLIENIPGDIIELGVCGGSGLFSFVQNVFIHEPQYQWRNIIGFDTFEGFVDVNEKDNINLDSHLKKPGAFSENNYHELYNLINVHQNFRFMNTRDQVELIKGDVCKTIPSYLEKNHGLIVAMLYCDLDLYEPTKKALEVLWPRIPKGGVVVLDEGIMRSWQGETTAFHEIIGIGNCRLKKIPYIKQFYLIKE